MNDLDDFMRIDRDALRKLLDLLDVKDARIRELEDEIDFMKRQGAKHGR